MKTNALRWALVIATIALPAFASAKMNTGGNRANYGTRRIQGGFHQDRQQVTVTSGGDFDVHVRRPDCAGWVTETPDLIVHYRRPAQFLRFFAESRSDVTLVINDPNGNWHCNDDRWGNQPGIDLQNPPTGQYDVWVGSYQRNERASSTLSITERQHVMPRDAAAPQPNPGGSGNGNLIVGGNRSRFGQSHLRAGFAPDPHVVAVTSGGRRRAERANSSCRGYVSRRPDHILHFDGQSSFLRILAAAQQGDVTLVVNDPNGRWRCADDTWGRNPGVDIHNPPVGQYDIWVGSYRRGDHTPTTLGITEHQHITTTQLLGATPTPTPGPHPHPGPQPAVQTYRFHGSFEGTEVTFSGHTHNELAQQCQQFLSAARLSHVDTVTVRGQRAWNSRGYWDNQALCAIAVLNAEPNFNAGGIVAQGQVDRLPFHVSGHLSEVRQVIQTYLPQALREYRHIQNITLNGRRLRNRSGYWNANQAATMISSQVH